jgi:hypothetical protein
LSQWTQATSGWIVEHFKEFPKCMWRAPYIHVKHQQKVARVCGGHIVKWNFSSTKGVNYVLFFKNDLPLFSALWYSQPGTTQISLLFSERVSYAYSLLYLAPIVSLPLFKSRHEISPLPMPQEILNNPPPPLNEVYPMHFQVRLFCVFSVLCVVLLALHALKKNF